MIQVDLTTTTGTQTQRVQKEVRHAVVFEATVPERHHVRVSINEKGAMTVTHAEWLTIGDTAQWVVQNHIAG